MPLPSMELLLKTREMLEMFEEEILREKGSRRTEKMLANNRRNMQRVDAMIKQAGREGKQ